MSVAVGPFSVTDTSVNGVKLRLGAPDSSDIRDALVPEFRRAIIELARRFGPFPFPSLSVARLPAEGGGIEYPSSILMLDGSRLVAVHETAHQWFYAMVGDSQALHPWLDEAFAQYAEQLVDGTPEPPPERCGAGDGRRVDRVLRPERHGALLLHDVRQGCGRARGGAGGGRPGQVGRRAALLRRRQRVADRRTRPDLRRPRCAGLPAAVADTRAQAGGPCADPSRRRAPAQPCRRRASRSGRRPRRGRRRRARRTGAA